MNSCLVINSASTDLHFTAVSHSWLFIWSVGGSAGGGGGGGGGGCRWVLVVVRAVHKQARTVHIVLLLFSAVCPNRPPVCSGNLQQGDMGG